LQVENTLFRVSRAPFETLSPVFSDIFLQPRGANPMSILREEGSSDDHPVVLQGYKKDDFEALLAVINPSYALINKSVGLTAKQWVGVLRLASAWKMDTVRKYSIKKLSKLDLTPYEKITWAQKFRVSEWLTEGVKSIVESDSVPPLEELSLVGWETATRI
ncbi:hypothetical protein FA15DRAFT_553450, partial [Coprinopsis marcescibilis]